jgi:hypothetical protein
MSTKIKILGLVLLAVCVAGGGVGYFMYHKPHADLGKAKPDFQLTAEALFANFESDEAVSNSLYLDKVIEVSGTLRELRSNPETGTVLLLKGETEMFGVNCALDPEQALLAENLNPGQEVRLRGLCTGMLMDVNLSRCVLVN